MDKVNFNEIDDARKILELGEDATLEEVKKTYRSLSKKWHPDKCKKDKELCHEMMKKINKAYKLINKYIQGYKYSFKEEKVHEGDIEQKWKKQFGSDHLWGTGQ